MICDWQREKERFGDGGADRKTGGSAEDVQIFIRNDHDGRDQK